MRTRLHRFLVATTLVISAATSFTVKAAPQGPNLVSQIASLTADANLVFWGEAHETLEQSQLLQDFLASDEGLKLDSIATEYVRFAQQTPFNNYLNDPTATAHSAGEKAFFDSLTAQNVIWVRSESSRNIFRAFWQLKRRKPQIKIFGIDYEYGEAAVNRQAWDQFPASLQQDVLKSSGQTADQLVADTEASIWKVSGVAYIREASMAFTIAHESVGRTLIHVGGYHGLSPSRYPRRAWIPVSVYLSHLRAQLKIFTLFLSNLPIEDLDPTTRTYRQWAQASGQTELAFQTATELQSSAHQDILRGELDPGHPTSLILWDAVLVGPPGHEDQISPY